MEKEKEEQSERMEKEKQRMEKEKPSKRQKPPTIFDPSLRRRSWRGVNGAARIRQGLFHLIFNQTRSCRRHDRRRRQQRVIRGADVNARAHSGALLTILFR